MALTTLTFALVILVSLKASQSQVKIVHELPSSNISHIGNIQERILYLERFHPNSGITQNTSTIKYLRTSCMDFDDDCSRIVKYYTCSQFWMNNLCPMTCGRCSEAPPLNENLDCKEGTHESYDYSKIHPQHSAALPANDQCKKKRQGVSDEEKNLILDIHNNNRAKVARGEEQRSAQRGVSQPSGTNIKQLVWNEELAYIAQKWAEQCNFQHETPDQRRSTCSRTYDYVGQNLANFWNGIPTSANEWSEATKAWYDEVADVPISVVKHYSSRAAGSKLIGHYAQMMWAETYGIGCGAVNYKGGSHHGPYVGATTLFVCNYGPGGNYGGEVMYKTGTPASECGESGVSETYPGLCATRQ